MGEEAAGVVWFRGVMGGYAVVGVGCGAFVVKGEGE